MCLRRYYGNFYIKHLIVFPAKAGIQIKGRILLFTKPTKQRLNCGYGCRISLSLIPIKYSSPSSPTLEMDSCAFSLTMGLA